MESFGEWFSLKPRGRLWNITKPYSRFARLSILFSIIKIESNPKFLIIIAGGFLVYGSVMVGQLYWVCEPIGHKWKDETAPQCPLGLQVVICQVICKSQMCMVFEFIFLKFNAADVVADSILLFFPLKIFQTLTDRALRRRLMIIFSTCIATTIVSLVHAAYIIASENIQILISAEVEVIT